MNKFQQLTNIFKGDKVIWIVFFMLCVISVVEVYSASSSLGYKSGNYWYAAFYHTGLLFVGLAAMVCVLNVKCRYFKIVTPLLVPLSFILLLLVFFVGTKENDAARWLKLFGIIPIQPSEIAKGAMVLATAQILSGLQTDNGADTRAMKYILYTACFLILPIAPENLSTAALLFGVVILMMIIGRVPLKQLGKMFSFLAIAGVILISLIMTVGQTPDERINEYLAQNTEMKMEDTTDGAAVVTKSKVLTPKEKEALLKKIDESQPKNAIHKLTHRFGAWKRRINDFFVKEDVPADKFDLDKDGQIGHANIAIVSSNIYGCGPGNSVERDFLSQAFSDFIYAIIIEELGILGAAFVAFLYIILLFRTGVIARRCKNPFPAYLAMGLAILMVSQALFNMCVAVSLAPITGQPLPLISKGGTSSIINCIYIGVILSISRTAQKIDFEEKKEFSTKKLKPAIANK